MNRRGFSRHLQAVHIGNHGGGYGRQAGPYATGASYYANGALKQFTYGNGIVHTLTQNARQLPERSRDALGGTLILDDSYDYDFSGNVAGISDGLAGAPGRCRAATPASTTTRWTTCGSRTKGRGSCATSTTRTTGSPN